MEYHPRVIWMLTVREVPPLLLEALEGEPRLTFPDSPRGAGMAGTSGAGKSFAMVRHLAARAQAILARHPDPDHALWPSRSVVWAGWVQKSEELKRWVAAGHHEALENWIEAAKTCGCLYLDDLGRERLTGPDDYALGLLREVLDHRHGHRLPVCWTCNLSAVELVEKWNDPALVGRLVEAWPPVRVKGANLRLGGRAS